MIGLSASMCIRDMVKGLVDPATVEKIIARTAVRPDEPDRVDSVVRTYRELYWYDDAEVGEKLFREMLADGKIEQPRLVTGRAPMITDGHWVEREDQITWTDVLN